MTEAIASADGGNGAVSGAIESSVAPASGNWYSSFDTETSGWLENRGLTKLDEKAAIPELVKGFRNAEKYIGTPADKLLRLPDWDKADKAELDQFYNKIGRPNDPKDYNIQVPDGFPTDVAESARTKFHEIGLNSRQADALIKWNDEMIAQSVENGSAAQQQQARDQEASLRAEWGHAYDKQIATAKHAAASIGLTADKIDALEMALGYDGVMKMMVEIGGKIGEASYISGSGTTQLGPMTPAQAVTKLASLRDDKAWVSSYMNGNAEARNEMDRLMRMAYPE